MCAHNREYLRADLLMSCLSDEQTMKMNQTQPQTAVRIQKPLLEYSGAAHIRALSVVLLQLQMVS
jgi:hypothetical protein